MIILEVIFIILINFSIAKCQQSCSDIANFYSDYYGTYGQVQISHVPLQQNSNFGIELSVAARLPSSNDWKIILVNKNVYDDLLNDRNIVLKFIPLIKTPLPVISGVFVNGNRICSSPPARGRYVSTIKMSYTYTINNIPQNIQMIARPILNQSWYHQNRDTTEKIIYTEPPTRPTQPPTTSTLPPAPQRQTTHINIDYKIGNTNDDQSYVCGVRRTQLSAVSFVIGGERAKKSDFPWLTAFYYRQNGFICGGTLVSTKIIVTAAHCVKDKQSIEIKSAESSTFYLGKYKLKDLDEKEYVSAGVSQFIIHPHWNSFEERYTGDLAIALLYRTIQFTNDIIPLCMPPQRNNHEDIVHKEGIVAGWGLTSNGTTSDVPMFVTLPVVDDGDCLRSDDAFIKITSSSTFCVGDGSGRSPCNGDSGGAFAVKNDADSKYYFRGIVSSGVRGIKYTCDNTKFAIFTDVAQYTDWIQSYITMYG